MEEETVHIWNIKKILIVQLRQLAILLFWGRGITHVCITGLKIQLANEPRMIESLKKMLKFILKKKMTY